MATAPRLHKSPAPHNSPAESRSGYRNKRLQHSGGLLLGAIAGAMGVFTSLTYQFPRGYNAIYWGTNPAAVQHFGAALGLHALTVGGDPAQWTLRYCEVLGLLWAAYAGLLACVLRGAKWRAAKLAAGVFLLGLSLAFLCPPLLTTDCYAYVAYARMLHLYGGNPYFHTPYLLFQHRDPVVPFLVWDLPSVYGPVWTWLSTACIAVLPASWLWGQIVAMKVVAAAALTGCALAARRIGEHYAPGRGVLAMLAVGLNPLLLIEGPCNGHNDLLLICFVLWSVAHFLEKRYPPAGLMLGLAIGVKLTPLALLPWMILAAVRDEKLPAARRSAVAALSAGAVLPSILGYIPLWHGTATLSPILQRASFHVSSAAQTAGARLEMWSISHGLGAAAGGWLSALWQHAPVALVYAALSVGIIRSRRRDTLVSAWAILSACLMFWAMGIPFPWYIAWFWPFLLIRVNRINLALSAGCFVLSFLWECRYAALAPDSWFRT